MALANPKQACYEGLLLSLAKDDFYIISGKPQPQSFFNSSAVSKIDTYFNKLILRYTHSLHTTLEIL